MPSSEPCVLVERSIELLIEVRIELQNRPEISWPYQLDDAIELLQRARQSTPPDHQLQKEVLRMIGAGLTAFPVIERLISLLRKD